jgi:hypothetical protein
MRIAMKTVGGSVIKTLGKKIIVVVFSIGVLGLGLLSCKKGAPPKSEHLLRFYLTSGSSGTNQMKIEKPDLTVDKVYQAGIGHDKFGLRFTEADSKKFEEFTGAHPDSMIVAMGDDGSTAAFSTSSPMSNGFWILPIADQPELVGYFSRRLHYQAPAGIASAPSEEAATTIFEIFDGGIAKAGTPVDVQMKNAVKILTVTELSSAGMSDQGVWLYLCDKDKPTYHDITIRLADHLLVFKGAGDAMAVKHVAGPVDRGLLLFDETNEKKMADYVEGLLCLGR